MTTLEERIATMDIPGPINGEDMHGYVRRCMLAAAHVGVAHGVVNAPPSIVYRDLGGENAKEGNDQEDQPDAG